jgi:acyl carrier protein
MTRQQLNNRLLDVFTSIGLSVTALTDQAHFSRDLGLDSLDSTDLMLQIETSFSIRIPDEDWWRIQTVGQLKTYLAGEVIFDGGSLM